MPTAHQLKQLAIERKTVVWPLDHAERHMATHFLMDLVLDAIGPITKDVPNALELEGNISISRDWCELFARRIVDSVTPLVGKDPYGQLGNPGACGRCRRVLQGFNQTQSGIRLLVLGLGMEQ